MELRFEEGERQAVTARLGLAEDASDEDLQTRLAAWLAEESSSESSEGDDESSGDETEAGIDDLDDRDVVVVDALSYQRLQARDRMAGQIEAANRVRDRDELIAEAVHDGKIGPGRAQHYRDRYDSDPEGTSNLLARLTPNTIPLEERGVDAAQEDVDDTSSYPREWLPEVSAQQGQGGSRRNRVTKD